MSTGSGCNVLSRVSIHQLVPPALRFEISDLDEGYSAGPKFASYLYYGTAV